jgi:hypothetical protein
MQAESPQRLRKVIQAPPQLWQVLEGLQGLEADAMVGFGYICLGLRFYYTIGGQQV